MSLDLRAIVRARMIEVHGGEEGAQRALAKAMTPLWGMTRWRSAEARLIRWFSGERDMTSDPLAAMLDYLDLDVLPRGPRREAPTPS